MAKRTRNREGSGSQQRPQETPVEPLDLLEIGPNDEDDLLEFEGNARNRALIKVIGVGGGGGNALNTMVRSGLTGVDFIAANTDAQALQHNEADVKLQLGDSVSRGLGCGADPERGRECALEDRDRLRDMLVDSDMVFVTAGMGGGTGTGAAPVVAEVAREIGALTVAVVTKPFLFEGRVRTRQAERGIEELHRVVDTLITIPNNRLLAVAGKDTAMKDAFALADNVLLNAVRGISDLITTHGLVNLDFADVRTIMNEMGMALMGTGTATGDTRAADAARAAISSPLLEDLSIEGARGVLINVTGSESMTLFEVTEASTLVQDAAHEDANIIFGAVVDETMPPGELRVTVIATGLDHEYAGTRGRGAGERVTARVPHIPQTAPLDGGITAEAVEPLGAEPEIEREPTPARGGSAAPLGEPPAKRADDFVSPFDDELEIPTFLRRQAD